ncbi:MAG: flagellar brake protein [Fimbriimonadaceae bacterium]|nr:flagellar brake protein [Fimbriimonadaceae bacterium]
MRELASALGLFLVVFGLSYTVSFIFSRDRRRSRGLGLDPHAKVRLVSAGGAYRCYFLREESAGIVLSTPLQRDRYVPLRVGDTLIVQVPQGDGLISFTSEVQSRSIETHELVISRPKLIRHMERRSEVRDSRLEGAEAGVNGQEAWVQNLSAGGACLVTHAPVLPGDIVSLRLPESGGAIEAWVLDSIPGAIGNRQGRRVRLLFQKPLDGLRLH